MKIRSLIPALILTLTSCGGGGGGGGGSNFAGTWQLTLVEYEDNCNISDNSIATPTYLINQDGTNVAAENLANGITYTGGVVEGGSGFIASRKGVTIPCPFGGSAIVQSELYFFDVSGNRASNVELVTSVSCPVIGECRTGHVGNAEKS